MDVKTIPPMKPVLVTDVSDNINVLQKDDVTKQRTVVTARALEDIFKCAPFKKTNPTDTSYYDGNDVDLDRVVTAQSRTLSADSYKNGPAFIFEDQLVGSDTLYSVNHQPRIIKPDAFLYVFSVLDDNIMTWEHDEHPISIEDKTTGDIEYRKVADRVKSPKIRQVFVANHVNEYLSIDPTKSDADGFPIYERTHRTRYNIGQVWTRLGTLQENGNYTWEDWYVQGKTHNGPEYFQNIITRVDNVTYSNPLVDSVYHIYGENVRIVLPNANLDGYKIGQKLIVEVHPVEGKNTSCTVDYQDTTAVGVVIGDPLSITLTPRIRRNTKDVFGSVRSDAAITSTAVFEICSRSEGDETFNTWELDAGVEETDFTAGLAEQLGEHTDLAVWDIVNAQSSYWNDKKVIDVIYPVTSNGYVVADFLKSVNYDVATWRAEVYVTDITTPLERATTITAGQEYYFRDTDKWVKVTATAGDTRDLYIMPATHSGYDVLTHNYLDSDIATRVSQLKMSDLTFNKKRRFVQYVHRGEIIHVRIYSESYMREFVGKLFPVIGFHPDQHDSYIQKIAINQSAFTSNQLRKLFEDGSIAGDIQVSEDDEFYKGVLNSPVSTNALINAYRYLAENLQSKGLLLGNVLQEGTINLDRLVSAGCHYITASAVLTPTASIPPSRQLESGFNLIVLTGTAPSGIIHEEQGGVSETSTAIQVALIPDGNNDKTKVVADVNIRVGTRDGSIWVWGPWKDLTGQGKQKYFHSRWDYFEDPNGIISFVDATANITGKQTCTGNIPANVQTPATFICEVPDTFISGLLEKYTESEESVTDVRHTDNINYKVPCIMVGMNAKRPIDILPNIQSGQKAKYTFHFHFPKATRPTESDVSRSNRRKIKMMFFGNPDLSSWDEILLKITYQDSYNTGTYSYERTWGTNSPLEDSDINTHSSIMVIEFEQILLPSGEMVWSPLEIG